MDEVCKLWRVQPAACNLVQSGCPCTTSPANIRVHDVCLQSSKHEDRKIQQHQVDQFLLEKPEKKERSSKTKDKRDKTTDEEKEMRKERKLGRKRVCTYICKNVRTYLRA